MPETQKRFRPRPWVRRAVPAGIVAALVLGGTALVRTNASASASDLYRTTTATTGSVEQRLNLTGSVRRVNQVSQGFAVAGAVSSVSVSVGDTVKVGQALATLDRLPLQRAVTAAEASLAKAKATLESDQSETATTAVTSAQTTVTSTTGPRAATPSSRSGAGQSLVQAQARVTTAQKAVATDLGRVSAALTQCAQFFPGDVPVAAPTGAPAPTPTTSETASPTPTTSETASPTPQPNPDELKACLGALKNSPTPQQIQRDQQTLARSQADLTKAYTRAITAAGATVGPAATTNQSGSAGQSAASRSAGARTDATDESAAARVISDKTAVTSATAKLSTAQADLASSTLKASIAGTVGSVTLVKGASSEGADIDIVGAGAVAVTVNVPLASIATVKMGQKAEVTARGAAASAPGTVTSISLLPSATSTGTGAAQATAPASGPAYPVVVLVPVAPAALASGSQVEVSVLIGAAHRVLTVPNSALTPLGNGQAMAMTLNKGVPTRTLVKTGYTGALTTEVTSGLTSGQEVVLADLSTPLPTNTTNSRRFGVAGGAAGGLGGAGLGGAGLGGPGPGDGRAGFARSG